jgi:Protein of unknown function (DUF3804)
VACVASCASKADELQGKQGEIVMGEEEEESEYDDIPTTRTRSNSLPPQVLTEDRIRSFMVDYYEDFNSIFQANEGSALEKRKECLNAFMEQYFTPDFCFVRSSGNPLNREEFVAQCAEDIEVISVSLVNIDSIQLLAGGMVAVVVYTADQVYRYKGTPNSDRATISAVVHSVIDDQGAKIRIGHEQRSVGKPIPKVTRWDSLA